MKKIIIIAAIALVAFSCRKENPVTPDLGGPTGVVGGIEGFFLLNQGQMGLNNASLDYYDYSTGTYRSDVFSAPNPNELGLGDTGNDLEIYGDNLYIVLNGSNFVTVVDARTAKLKAKVPVSSPRSIAFDGNFAYVTSFAGAGYQLPDNLPGFVAKIDLTTFTVAGECTVGYQPEELAVVGGKLYVANSGGLQSTYETTLSVIDLASFTVTSTIEVVPNLWRVLPDGTGKLYVSSRGAYDGVTGPATYVVDTATGGVVGQEPVLAAENITLGSGMLYGITTDYPAPDYSPVSYYKTYNTLTGAVGGNFINDASVDDISVPFEISVHPATGALFVTDAGDYQHNGVLHFYTPDGLHSWATSTGVIPASIAFTTTKLQ